MAFVPLYWGAVFPQGARIGSAVFGQRPPMACLNASARIRPIFNNFTPQCPQKTPPLPLSSDRPGCQTEAGHPKPFKNKPGRLWNRDKTDCSAHPPAPAKPTPFLFPPCSAQGNANNKDLKSFGLVRFEPLPEKWNRRHWPCFLNWPPISGLVCEPAILLPPNDANS